MSRGLIVFTMFAVAACGSVNHAGDPDAAVGDPDAATGAPESPTLVEIPGACGGDAGLDFAWSEVSGASYRLTYGDGNGAPTVVDLDVGVTSYTPSPPLGLGTWSWSVIALRDGQMSEPASSTIVVSPVPAAPTATASSVACPGDQVELTASDVPGGTYHWTGPNGFTATGRVVDTAAATGTYSVTVSVNGCTSPPGMVDIAAGNAATYLETLATDFADDPRVGTGIEGDAVTLHDLATGNGGNGAYSATSNTTLNSGTYDFTSFSISSGVTVTVIGDAPLVIRSTGAVSIAGTLLLRGGDGTPGVTSTGPGLHGTAVAGGGNGGDGVYSSTTGPLPGSAGSGAGGGGNGDGWSGGGGGGHAGLGGATGGASGGFAGAAYSSVDLAAALGGSGGGGGSGGYNCGAGGGGAGGGFVHITAPAITIGGAINAAGGAGGSDGNGNCGAGGGGSGGSVWLAASQVTFVGGSVVDVSGGAGGVSTLVGQPYYGVGGIGAPGRLRVDATTINGTPSTAPISAIQGTIESDAITAACSWGVLSYTTTVPAGANVTVDVLDANDNLLASDVASGTDLSTLPNVDASATIRLRATLSTTTMASPSLTDWSVGYVQ